MKTRILVLILALQFCVPQAKLMAGLLGASNEDAGMPGAFLRFGSSARSLAMGKAFTGVANDAGAIYFNPAGLAGLKEKELTTMYSSLYENTIYGYLGYVHPLHNKNSENTASAGVALVNLASEGFQLRDEYNNSIGEGSTSESAAILSYSSMLWKNVPGLSQGVNLKIVQQSMHNKTAAGFGLDAGLLWKPGSQKFSAGMCIQNLVQPVLKLSESEETYPVSAAFGISYRLLNNKLLLSSDLIHINNGLLKYRLGSELGLAKLFVLRAGLNESEVAGGLGFKMNSYELDYAFAYHLSGSEINDLGASHRFGIRILFN